MKVEIKVLDARLHEAGINYATPGAAAIDVRACSINGETLTAPYIVRPGERVKIGGGFSIHCGSMTDFGGEPACMLGWSVAALLLARSGLGSNGRRLSNNVGLLDADYQGEYIVAFENANVVEFTIWPLDRIAQMMIVPVIKPELIVVDEFSNDTARGASGFGSTGK
jgi:dUTP pyrophosphatase